MCHGARKLDVTHALATYFSESYFDATLLTDNTAMLQTLVLPTQTLVVLNRTKDLRAEQTIALGLKRPIVDRLGLFNFTV